MSKRLTKGSGKGRPRVYATDMPVYDSQKAASAATGIPIQAFDVAQDEGCLFVRHGRIHIGEFIHWWFNRDADESGDSHQDWNKRDKRASALNKEFNLQKARDEVVEFSSVKRFIEHLVGTLFFGEIERLAQLLPGQLKAKTEIEIAEDMDEHRKRLKKLLQDAMTSYIEKKGKE